MALRGHSPQATLIALNGYDPHRLYYDIPVSGGWRECRDPIGGRRYWNLVNMNLTSWSLVDAQTTLYLEASRVKAAVPGDLNLAFLLRALKEVLRLNALEEFLLLGAGPNGEWTLFTVIPEKLEEYEDPGYRYNVFSTVEMTGQPIEVLKPGTVVTTVGMPKPGRHGHVAPHRIIESQKAEAVMPAGIVEILLPDADGVAKLGFAKYRWPPQALQQDGGEHRYLLLGFHCSSVIRWKDGTRYLQRLPARMRTDDVAGMNAVVTPVWLLGVQPLKRLALQLLACGALHVLAGQGSFSSQCLEPKALRREMLSLSQRPLDIGRDPRSEPLGWLKVGTSIGLNLIEGTRALVGWIHEDEEDLVDGWISFVRLDGSPTLRRVLEETTNQKIQRELQEHLKAWHCPVEKKKALCDADPCVCVCVRVCRCIEVSVSLALSLPSRSRSRSLCLVVAYGSSHLPRR
ncbi:unnamed protein product [Symbiodinium sp. CCMP2592]|nr:unnamed protein product [Symbiodinium sp. CCMP2592]